MSLATSSEIMDVYRNTVIKICNTRYQQILEEFSKSSDSKVVVSHFGEFSQDLVNSLSVGVEEIMFESGDKKGPVKRMFSILVEGLQNIRIHGERDEDGSQAAFLIVNQKEEIYDIHIGNLILNDNIEFVSNKIETLNKMDADQVKEHYMEVLTNGIMSNKGGAGLGFITIAMKSKSKISYKLQEINDIISCFSYSVELIRKK